MTKSSSFTIDTTPGDPEIRYDVVKIDDTVDGTLTVKKITEF